MPLKDLELPDYNIALTIPTIYTERILGRIDEFYLNTLEQHTSEEEKELIRQITRNPQAPFNKELKDGVVIEMQDFAFTSPWQLASDLSSMVYYAVKEVIDSEKSLSPLNRSDLEKMLKSIEGANYGITEDDDNTATRNVSARAIEEKNRAVAVEHFDAGDAAEVAEHEDALRAAAPYSPSTDELELAAEFDSSPDANEVGAAQVAAADAAEVAEHTDALRAAALHFPSADELALAAAEFDASPDANEVGAAQVAAADAAEVAMREDALRAAAPYSPNADELELAAAEFDASPDANEVGAAQVAAADAAIVAEHEDALRAAAPYSPNADELELAAEFLSQVDISQRKEEELGRHLDLAALNALRNRKVELVLAPHSSDSAEAASLAAVGINSERTVINNYWYTNTHIEDLGIQWQRAEPNRLFVPISPPGEFAEELTYRTGITKEHVDAITAPCKILLPINKGNNHWAAITINVTATETGQKRVDLHFTDSYNQDINHDMAIEVVRICNLFDTAPELITDYVYPHTWMQEDGSSCGPYAFANAVRCLDGKGDEPNPGRTAIRMQQLEMMTNPVGIRSCSTNNEIDEIITSWVIERHSNNQSYLIDSHAKLMQMCRYFSEIDGTRTEEDIRMLFVTENNRMFDHDGTLVIPYIQQRMAKLMEKVETAIEKAEAAFAIMNQMAELDSFRSGDASPATPGPAILYREDPDDPIEEFTPTSEKFAAAAAGIVLGEQLLPANLTQAPFSISFGAVPLAATRTESILSLTAGLAAQAAAARNDTASRSPSIERSRSGSQTSDTSASGAGVVAVSDRASTKSATSAAERVESDASSQLSKEREKANAGAGAEPAIEKPVVGPHTAALLSQRDVAGKKRKALASIDENKGKAAGLASVDKAAEDAAAPSKPKKARSEGPVVVERFSRRVQERIEKELSHEAAILAKREAQQAGSPEL